MSSKFSKLFSWLHRSRAEEGQAMVMVALSLVVILGFGAFAVDLGHVAVVKSDLQNAADAAALAGAADLVSSKSAADQKTAEDKAVDYAIDNDMDVVDNHFTNKGDTVDADALSGTKLQVKCTRKVDYYFAGVIGFKSKEVSAVAVAEKESPNWAGESLPFLNLDGDYTSNATTVWGPTSSPGDKGVVTDFWIRDTNNKTYFEIEYNNGITLTKGFSNGQKSTIPGNNDQTSLKAGLDKVLLPIDQNVKVVYVLSLRADIIKYAKSNSSKACVYLADGSLVRLDKLKNGDVIRLDQLVLLQCLFITCDWNNQHKIKLGFPTAVYDLGSTIIGKAPITKATIPNLPNFPTEYLTNSNGSGVKLIL